MPDFAALRSAPTRLKALLEANHGTARGFVRLLLAQAELVLGRLEAYRQRDLSGIKRLVFVCLGNINRSAFAEWVARGRGATVCSIGLSTTTGAPAFKTAIATARAFGVDLTAHSATDMTDYRYQPGDLLLAMEIRHVHALRARGIPREAIALLGYWAAPQRMHLHDPHTLSDAYYRTCFNLIHSAVTRLVDELRTAQSPCVLR